MKKSNKKRVKNAIKKEIKKNKELRYFLVTSLVVLLVIGVGIGVYYYFYIDNQENDIPVSTELGEPNVTNNLSWNKTYSLEDDSPFYQYNANEIKTYYKNIDFDVEDKTIIQEKLFETLKNGHKKINYDGKNSEYKISALWANYCLADRDWDESPLLAEEVKNNKRNMTGISLDILYQSNNLSFTSTLGSQGYIDREHIYPKSYGFNMNGEGYKELVAGCDLHNLYTADKAGNITGHVNRLFNNIDSINKSEVISKDGKTKSYYTEDYYEPPIEDRGNIARAIFYMASRYYSYYEDELGESPRLVIDNVDKYIGKVTYNPTNTQNGNIKFGVLNSLLKRNIEDKVDNNEMIRNNSVYHIQGNRNPFIDYPNLANKLFN